MQGPIQDFFMGGGHTLVRPLGGLVACSPRKFLYSTLDSDLILGGGGGGGTQAGGGKSQCSPPSVCNPEMYISEGIMDCFCVLKHYNQQRRGSPW